MDFVLHDSRDVAMEYKGNVFAYGPIGWRSLMPFGKHISLYSF